MTIIDFSYLSHILQSEDIMPLTDLGWIPTLTAEGLTIITWHPQCPWTIPPVMIPPILVNTRAMRTLPQELVRVKLYPGTWYPNTVPTTPWVWHSPM